MNRKNFKAIGFFGILLGCVLSFYSCGEDSSSSTEYIDIPEESSSSQSDKANSSAEKNEDGKSSDSKTTIVSSSSLVVEETVSGKETLMEAQKKVNGSCGPSKDIDKGDIATWEFYRSEGEVYDQIMAPFVWTLPGAKTESLQGNGLSSVNVRYESSGTYKASLNVDGNEVDCAPLLVKGIPITIKSCTADASTVNAGKSITWTVDATSESEIVSYSWTSDYGNVSGNSNKGTLVADASMHKKTVSAKVTVTNKDKTPESYTCDGVTVVDPEQVDYTFIEDAELIEIPTQQTFVAQIPSCSDPYNGTTACTFTCDTKSTAGEKATVEIEGIECAQNNATYIQCSLKSVAGQKISIYIQANVSTIYCGVSKY